MPDDNPVVSLAGQLAGAKLRHVTRTEHTRSASSDAATSNPLLEEMARRRLRKAAKSADDAASKELASEADTVTLDAPTTIKTQMPTDTSKAVPSPPAALIQALKVIVGGDDDTHETSDWPETRNDNRGMLPPTPAPSMVAAARTRATKAAEAAAPPPVPPAWRRSSGDGDKGGEGGEGGSTSVPAPAWRRGASAWSTVAERAESGEMEEANGAAVGSP